MEFGLVTFCIGPCPIVFLARIPSLVATTICLKWVVRKVAKLLSIKNQLLRISAISVLLLLSAIASIVVNHILFSLIVNLIGGGGICTGFVHASPIEMCIPSLGTFFILIKEPKRRITKYFHVLSKILFFAAVTMSLYYSIFGNLILYDIWGLNFDWPYHGDYATYLKYEWRINTFGTAVVIYCSLVFSIVFNRLVRFLKPTDPIGKLFWFILGLFISWIIPLFCYSQISKSLSSYGFFFLIPPGYFAGLIT